MGRADRPPLPRPRLFLPLGLLRRLGDADVALTVEGYWRGTDRSRFEGRLWQLDAAQGLEGVELAGDRGRALFRIQDLLAEPPGLLVLDRDGRPRADCAPSLEPVAPPRERVDALLALLTIDAPSPADAAAARTAWDALPPPQLLGPDGAALLRELEAARAGFEERHRATILTAAADPEGADVVAALVVAWLNGGGEPHLPQADAELLLAAQRARAEALAAAGRDPADALAASPEALCARLEGLQGRWEWDEALELVTGLPLGHWTSERSEAVLGLARACPGGEDLARTLAERQAAIEDRAARARTLAAERDRLLAVPLTLKAVAAAGWLVPDGEALRAHGLSSREAEEALGPVLAPRRAAAVEALADELAAELEAGDVPLEDHPYHCVRRLSAPDLGGIGELHQAVAEACTARAAGAFEAALRARLREREATMTGGGAEGASLVRFDLAPLRPPLAIAWDARGPFREAADRVQAELDAVGARTEPAYQAALAATLAAVEEAHAAADPAEPDIMTIAPACAEVMGPGASTGPRMTPLLALCGRLGDARRARAEALVCDHLWEEARAPEGMRWGLLALPLDIALSAGVSAVTLNDLVCLDRDVDGGLAVERQRGLLSSEHRLVHHLEWGGAPVVVSARLVPPAAEGGPWTLADGRVVRDAGDERPVGGPSDRLLGCVLRPAGCPEIAAP